MIDSTTQLEMFDSVPQGAPKPRPIFHIGTLPVRYDHLVLVLLLGLVASSMVFAVGVERGKRLARVERTLVAPPIAASPSSTASSSAKSASSGTTKEAAESDASKDAAPALKAAPAKPRKTPVKVAEAGVSKFAMQVVTFRQPDRARQELQRLQQRGERAFLIKKSDRVTVLVGPFPSKAHAASRVAGLKGRYQDCFVKSL